MLSHKVTRPIAPSSGFSLQHAVEPVIGNAAAQMMHVMDTDIGGEPAQHAGQHIIRAAVQRGLVQVPGPVVFPQRMLELVLHVEQPDAEGRGQDRDRQMHQQEGAEADLNQISNPAISATGGIGRLRAQPGPQPARMQPTGRRCCKMNI